MKKFILIVFVFALVFSLTACKGKTSADTHKEEIIISAASSLTDALTELKASFEAIHPNIIITYNLGSSGRLAEQLEQGAPSDIYLSASQKYMDQAADKGLIKIDTRVNFTSNEMVLIINKANNSKINSFKSLDSLDSAQIAIGNPDSVPAGGYAKEILTNLQLWDKIHDELVYGKNVRQVLAYVESGNADIGIVYSSDALISKQVKVIAKAEPDWHTPIVYPGAILKDTKHLSAAKTYLDYLLSDKGKNILKKYGFK